VRFPRALLEEIVQHARDDMPNECCGIVASDDGTAVKVFRATNSEASPVRYSLDPREQYAITMEIEERGWELGAIYHSHTRSEAYPSQTDVNLAFYPDALYLIVSLRNPDEPEVRAFRIADEQIDEVEVSVGDSA
jgi:[CysO sulfur-carrier protein]-S-L-cysteine hydrolase